MEHGEKCAKLSQFGRSHALSILAAIWSDPVIRAFISTTMCGIALLPSLAAQTTRIRVTNSASFFRENEMISLTRTALGETGDATPSFRVHGRALPSQLISNTPGRSWDAALLSVSLRPHSSESIHVVWKIREPERKSALSDVRLSLRSASELPTPNIDHEGRARGSVQSIAKPKYQMEGPGIENDKFVLRMFFDPRNGKDLYGKLTSEPVMSQIGLRGSWHKLQGWGMDILKTGNSIGAGGLAVQESGSVKRLGDADYTSFDHLYDGPLGAAFHLHFDGWDVGSTKQMGDEVLSIVTGDYLVADSVTVPLNPSQRLVTGLPNFDPSIKLLHTIHNPRISSISTWGSQAEGTGTKLGLAIFFPTADFESTASTESGQGELPNSSYVVLHPHSQTEVLTLAVCWERTDARFGNEARFHEYIRRTADRLAYPIRIKFSGHQNDRHKGV